MAINDLTTVARVRAWIDGVEMTQPAATDAELKRLITGLSVAILNQIGRSSLLLTDQIDVYDGKGTQKMPIRNWPVLSVSSVIVNNRTISPGPANGLAQGYATQGAGGYYFQAWDGVPAGRPSMMGLIGAAFSRGISNVTLAYLSGYGVLKSPQVIPADPYQLSISPVWGRLAGDYKVTLADGTAMTPVAATPAPGQYVPPSPFADFNPTSVYQFNAADAGKPILVSYSFVPADLEQAALEWAAERMKYRERIGLRSKSLGGQETMSWDISAVPKFVQAMLGNYENVVTFF